MARGGAAGDNKWKILAMIREQKLEGKRLGMWFGIIIGTEGALIAATSILLSLTSYGWLIIRSIALIVGVGVALATAVYGVYMGSVGYQMLRPPLNGRTPR